MTEKKKGFLARRAEGAARYVGRRFGNQFINEVGIDTVKKGAKGAREAMTPEELDSAEFKAGLEGRYSDGGVARFAEVMRSQGVRDEDLPALANDRRRSAGVMFLSAAGFLVLGAYLMITAKTGQHVLFGFTTAFTALVFVALGIRHDFSRWQIENRRFGGFKEFLKGSRAGSTGQEITKK